jgi:peptidoglycan-N-acetylglucosamine deacetylase
MRISSMLRPMAVALLFALLAARAAAAAGECKGNPNALGTSRVITVDATEHGRIGTMQYPETLPLRDHELVLTFDDGPLPPHSTRILDILASECVRATFFLIGRMAADHPHLVRRAFKEGHTIATHTQSHPAKILQLSAAEVETDIDDGIASVSKALGNPSEIAPFFRFPGLGRSAEVEAYLASRGIMVWSADFPADDWIRRLTPKDVAARALERLEKKGKGVLLLHDIHRVTVLALPELLTQLKLRRYKIVHVVAAAPGRPKTATEPAQWMLHARAK